MFDYQLIANVYGKLHEEHIKATAPLLLAPTFFASSPNNQPECAHDNDMANVPQVSQ